LGKHRIFSWVEMVARVMIQRSNLMIQTSNLCHFSDSADDLNCTERRLSVCAVGG
jgi:hypothetical protein